MTESLESTGVWLVHPNATDASKATFAAKTLYFSKSSTETVGFGGSLNGTEALTDVWSINGHYVLAGITGQIFMLEAWAMIRDTLCFGALMGLMDPMSYRLL